MRRKVDYKKTSDMVMVVSYFLFLRLSKFLLKASVPKKDFWFGVPEVEKRP